MKRLLPLYLLLLSCFAALPPACATTVRLKPQATIDGDVIRLGEIAQISNASTATEQLLSAMTIAAAPAAEGQTLRLTRDQVHARMLVGGVNLAEVVLVGATEVTVERSVSAPSAQIQAAPVPRAGADDLTECIREYVSRRIDAGEFEVKVRLTGGRPADFPAGARLMVRGADRKVAPGELTFTVVGYVDRREAARTEVPAVVELAGKAMVAVRDIPAGARVEEDMVALRAVSPTQKPAELLTGSADVVGRRLVHAVKADQALRSDDLDDRVVVKHGDPVVVTLRSKGFHVEVKALARGRGAPGDRVLFVNAASQRTFEAVVVGPGRAELIVGGDGR